MSWREFAYLLSGISGESPLGRIVSIRAENDPEHLRSFTPEQRRIRNDWRRKVAKTKSDKDVASAIDQFKQAFINLAK